ncbi:amidase [Kaistia dalseonensis]|uniref:Asp-tRNA(Asn)/Glu-tRNA(Gln) amidotransferase A subunit family amidase n=1 Tax=Kaistia dalseonensis TaxID=410840 RepID=A0ABU0HAA9_9HYPH|nr:amidase [Kaistia dalseonensis]MCX5496195.1 amidase [Kaistia dalseonensis]MDQ0438808.1 Asp-tRNA(Asn)/Glu-tRNA(Gln) amidotransferase A subunit family amidase [Kaistia dalseonensis]
MEALFQLSARELVQRLRAGTVSARAVIEAHLARIDALEPDIQAWAWLDRGQALAAATEADAVRASGATLGPLHGLPVGVKDIIDTADMPTEYGTPIHKGRRPQADATIVERLRSAGAIILGKTVTSEHAVYVAGPTRNPHALDRTPGGSSSGSAAAVAAFMVPVALSTQTNGSTIRPASFCGVVGYKPSLGLLPRTGILKQSSLLDHPGIITRSTADAAFVVEAIGGEDPLDEQSLGLSTAGLVEATSPINGRPRLAFIRSPYWLRTDPTTRAGLEALVESLDGAIDIVDLPPAFDAAADILSMIMAAGIAQTYREDFDKARPLMADVLVRIIEDGQRVSATAFLDAWAARDTLRCLFDQIIAPYDAALTPSAIGVAPLRSDGTGDPIFASLWTLLGVPAISLPLLQGAHGLPLGVQLVSGTRQDRRLLSTAAWLERARPVSAGTQ